MTYGLTPTGFRRKPHDVILSEVNAKQREDLGDEWDTSPASPEGVMNGSIVTQLAELWELGEAVHGSFDPDKAQDAQLDVIGALTGTIRGGPVRSTAPGTITIDPGVSLEAEEFVVSVDGNEDARFTNRDPVPENTTGDPQVVDVVWIAEEPGPVVANANTLTVIETPLSGVSEPDNGEDATPGRLVESNVLYRLRREVELAAAGSATAPAILAHLSQLDGVADQRLFVNDEDFEVNGLPSHSVEAVILPVPGYDPTELAEEVTAALWDFGVAAGIRTHGTEVHTAAGTDGEPHEVRHSLADEVDVWLEIDISTGGGYAGDNAVREAVAAFQYGIGQDVILSKLYCEILAVSGVTDILEIRAGFSASPSGTSNLSIGPRQSAMLDTSRVTVNP